MRSKLVVLVLAVALPSVAAAQNSIASRIGVGAQMTCTATAPTHVSARGMVWCKSTDSNKLHYTDPSGADVAIGGSGFSITTLTDGATISTDASLGSVFQVTLGGNRTLANPTNLIAGGTYMWIITQDGTGSRTLTYGSNFKWPSGTAPTLTTAAGSVDMVTAVYDGTKLRAVFNGDFR